MFWYWPIGYPSFYYPAFLPPYPLPIFTALPAMIPCMDHWYDQEIGVVRPRYPWPY